MRVDKAQEAIRERQVIRRTLGLTGHEREMTDKSTLAGMLTTKNRDENSSRYITIVIKMDRPDYVSLLEVNAYNPDLTIDVEGLSESEALLVDLLVREAVFPNEERDVAK